MESPEVRRRTMQAVKSKDTAPEMIVRRMLHAQGFRYRLHRRDLPGCPDIVFPKKRKIIFIHGCFWHGHSCARGGRVPKTNIKYWSAKISRNVERDAAEMEKLTAMGWASVIVWECELVKDSTAVIESLVRFLDLPSAASRLCHC